MACAPSTWGALQSECGLRLALQIRVSMHVCTRSTCVPAIPASRTYRGIQNDGANNEKVLPLPPRQLSSTCLHLLESSSAGLGLVGARSSVRFGKRCRIHGQVCALATGTCGGVGNTTSSRNRQTLLPLKRLAREGRNLGRQRSPISQLPEPQAVPWCPQR